MQFYVSKGSEFPLKPMGETFIEPPDDIIAYLHLFPGIYDIAIMDDLGYLSIADKVVVRR